MLNIIKTLHLKATGRSERVLFFPFFVTIFTKPVSLLVDTFFSPRIITAQVLVDDCIVYSSTKKSSII